ncbi:hypothetical protein HanRHA438_Chr12g0539011 [Helianthus annuus]|nr:hypothetical protein HanRHA438_Chr12g0539011 [Helianthus annuus]
MYKLIRLLTRFLSIFLFAFFFVLNRKFSCYQGQYAFIQIILSANIYYFISLCDNYFGHYVPMRLISYFNKPIGQQTPTHSY